MQRRGTHLKQEESEKIIKKKCLLLNTFTKVKHGKPGKCTCKYIFQGRRHFASWVVIDMSQLIYYCVYCTFILFVAYKVWILWMVHSGFIKQKHKLIRT